MNQQYLRPEGTELNQQDPQETRLNLPTGPLASNRPTEPLPTTPGSPSTHLPESTHDTHERHERRVEESSTIRPAKNQESPFGLTLFLYGTVALMVGIIAWIIALLASLKG